MLPLQILYGQIGHPNLLVKGFLTSNKPVAIFLKLLRVLRVAQTFLFTSQALKSYSIVSIQLFLITYEYTHSLVSVWMIPSGGDWRTLSTPLARHPPRALHCARAHLGLARGPHRCGRSRARAALLHRDSRHERPRRARPHPPVGPSATGLAI